MESLLREGLESVQPRHGHASIPGSVAHPARPGHSRYRYRARQRSRRRPRLRRPADRPRPPQRRRPGDRHRRLGAPAGGDPPLRCDLNPADHERLLRCARRRRAFPHDRRGSGAGRGRTRSSSASRPRSTPTALPTCARCAPPARRSSPARAAARPSSSPRPATSAPPATCSSSRWRPPASRSASDVCVAFSPERIDPANTVHPQESVPRVLGASSAALRGPRPRRHRGGRPSVHVVSSPGGGGDDEALRERLPRRQHLARQRDGRGGPHPRAVRRPR